MNKRIWIFVAVSITFWVSCGDSQKSEESQITADGSTMNSSSEMLGNTDLKANLESISLAESGLYSTQAMSSSPTKWFKKTKNKCSIYKSGNGCSGYWGVTIQMELMKVLVKILTDEDIDVPIVQKNMD